MHGPHGTTAPVRLADPSGYPLTTASTTAATAYGDAVGATVTGSPAAGHFARALAADLRFALARAGLALSSPAPRVARLHLAEGDGRLTRRERQHVDVAVALLEGDTARASALGSEHLAEFPLDLVIAHHLLSSRGAGSAVTTVLRRAWRRHGSDPLVLALAARHGLAPRTAEEAP